MSRPRWEITGTLLTLSPLHVGSGVVSPLGDASSPPVARIQRDDRKRPHIPGSTLKGVLRRAAMAAIGQGEIDLLFGEVKDRDAPGRPGAIFFRGASCVEPGDAGAFPYAAQSGPGLFIAARTRIDRDSGVAAHNKLFLQEMVVPDSRFALSLACLGASGETAPPAGLLALLRHAARPDGLTLGKGGNDGFGRLRLDADSVRITLRHLDAEGELQAADRSGLWSAATDSTPQPASWQHTLDLFCAGPFLVADSSHVPATGGDEPQIVAQCQAGGQPLLLGSSLSGALRSRAAWLAALDGTDGRDDPDRVLRKAGGTGTLTPVERLFGINGFRGLLEIRRLDVAATGTVDIASVKLDRFSGAPIDNALYATRAFIGARLTVTLALADRGGTTATVDDRTLADALLRDIAENGIALGLGENKGFGWFEKVG